MRYLVWVIAVCMTSVSMAGDKSSWLREEALCNGLEETPANPELTIHQLRIAVAANPHDIDSYVGLIHLLSTYRQDDEPEQISRLALTQNPSRPELLIARAQALGGSAALDTLAELKKVPGEEEEAARLSEIVSLGIFIPSRHGWEQAYTYDEWADRLLYVGKVDRAKEVVDEGIARSVPQGAEALSGLPGRKAIVLALEKQFDEAMKLQHSAGFPQIMIEGKYAGLADVLLLMTRPALAIDSFGVNPGQRRPEVEIRNGAAERMHEGELNRILAWAYASVGKRDKAEALLAGSADIPDRLLLIRIFSDGGDLKSAGEVADGLVDDAVRDSGRMGSRIAPRLPPDSAASLAPYYLWSVRRIMDTHAGHSREIVEYLGSPSHPWPPYPPFPVGILPTAQSVANARNALAAAQANGDARQIADCRRGLIRALSSGYRYKDGEDEAAVLATLPTDRWTRDNCRVNYDAVQWCTLLRKADGDALFRSNPAPVISANELLQISEDRYWNEGHVDDNLSDQERIDQIVRFGPGVLSVVYHYFQPNTISGMDRSVCARVIGELGGLEDAPVLIDTMGLITKSQLNGRNPSPSQDHNDDVTVQAIEAAMEKITGAKPPSVQPAGQVQFWVDWWDLNCRRIVAQTRLRKAVKG